VGGSAGPLAGVPPPPPLQPRAVFVGHFDFDFVPESTHAAGDAVFLGQTPHVVGEDLGHRLAHRGALDDDLGGELEKETHAGMVGKGKGRF